MLKCRSPFPFFSATDLRSALRFLFALRARNCFSVSRKHTKEMSTSTYDSDAEEAPMPEPEPGVDIGVADIALWLWLADIRGSSSDARFIGVRSGLNSVSVF